MADIEYLYAHAVTQAVIYSSKDTNDYLSPKNSTNLHPIRKLKTSAVLC